ncbi:MAG TPA: DnaA N-terminal domain-containing protein, partial [Polyangiaceae bacterium LLY-WYZ-14_1]|nr:DnaA N-terminal domain-containing protein [Polyangiaceae bacterium LLY-WYZ-14_1]
MTELWEQALGQLRDRLSGENFDTWLAPVRCDGVENGSVVLRIPNRFFQDWISSNYLDLILEVLHEHSGSDELQVRWVVDEDLQPRPARP